MTKLNTTWQAIRSAVGVMGGEPADAVPDTAALYDEPFCVPFRPYESPITIRYPGYRGPSQHWPPPVYQRWR